MRTVAIIQARYASSRLPGKVLENLAGRTMLDRVVARVRRVAAVDAVAVATTTDASDDLVESECGLLGVPVYRGDPRDVLDRVYQAATAQQADVVVRITADCPLVCPTIIQQVIELCLSESADYACAVPGEAVPRGLDVETIRMGALALAWLGAQEEYQRAHVTPYIYTRPQEFRLAPLRAATGELAACRLTVDTAADLRMVRAVLGRLPAGDGFTWRDVRDCLRREPALAAINAHVAHKSLRAG